MEAMEAQNVREKMTFPPSSYGVCDVDVDVDVDVDESIPNVYRNKRSDAIIHAA